MKEDKTVGQLIKEIHETATNKGFWENMESVLSKMNVDTYGESYRFTDNEIKQVRKAFIMQKLMLIVSELGEAIESDRKSRSANWEEFESQLQDHRRENIRELEGFKLAFEGNIKDTFEDEIADVIIRIFDLCGKMDIDIMKHINYKMKYNKNRSKLHNKEY